MTMSTMELEGLRTDAPPSVKRYLGSPGRWAIALASLLVASCGDFKIPNPAGNTPQDAPASPDAAVDAPVDVAADALVDAPRECVTTDLDCTVDNTHMVVCNAQCWVLCNDWKIANNARGACEDWGGALGELNNMDDDDQQCVATIIHDYPSPDPNGDPRVWLGLRQDESATAVDGDWTWNPSRGATLPKFTRWAPNQPDDGGLSPDDAGGFVEHRNEQCMNVDASGLWHDGPCKVETHPFLCRRP